MNIAADEITLVQACCDDKHQAQKQLFDRYAEQMMILCYRYITDSEDAKEVMLDAFFNAFKSIRSFRYQGEGSFKAWLKKIVVNQCLMHLRKNKPVFVHHEEVVNEEAAAFDDNIIAGMSAREILQMVHDLPDGYRTVFNLYVFEGMNHREIGTLLGISENTSKSQFHKAKAVLQKKLLQNI